MESLCRPRGSHNLSTWATGTAQDAPTLAPAYLGARAPEPVGGANQQLPGQAWTPAEAELGEGGVGGRQAGPSRHVGVGSGREGPSSVCPEGGEPDPVLCAITRLGVLTTGRGAQGRGAPRTCDAGVRQQEPLHLQGADLVAAALDDVYRRAAPDPVGAVLEHGRVT